MSMSGNSKIMHYMIHFNMLDRYSNVQTAMSLSTLTHCSFLFLHHKLSVLRDQWTQMHLTVTAVILASDT